MSKQELVEAYVRGQISRRQFIRKLVVSGVSLVSAVGYAQLLSPGKATAATRSVSPAHYGHDRRVVILDDGLTPRRLKVQHGQTVEWLDEGQTRHRVTSTSGFFRSPQLEPGQFFLRQFLVSGTFNYTVGPTSFPGSVGVPTFVAPSQAGPGDRVEVYWAAFAALRGFLYDVQIRRPGEPWRDWKTGVERRWAPFSASKEGIHRFRARIVNVETGKMSGYSPSDGVLIG